MTCLDPFWIDINCLELELLATVINCFQRRQGLSLQTFHFNQKKKKKKNESKREENLVRWQVGF